MVTVTSTEIKDILQQKTGCSESIIHTPDTFYNLMKWSFIHDFCYPCFRKWLKTHDIVKWTKSFDCDNYAESMRVYVQIIHSNYARKVRERQSHWSSAFGVIWYRRKKLGGHAINILLTVSGNEYRIIYIEPQTGEEIKLTQEEIDSINFILI